MYTIITDWWWVLALMLGFVLLHMRRCFYDEVSWIDFVHGVLIGILGTFALPGFWKWLMGFW